MSRLISKQAEEIAEHVELWIDGYIQNLINNDYNKKRRLVSLLNTYKIKKSDSKRLCEWFTSLKEELEEAINHNDPDLVEGYNFLSPSKLKKLHDFVAGICDDLENHSKITKRKRKRKPEVVVKNLKYMKSANIGKFKIESFDPKKILDSKSFLVYNTKTSDLSYYVTKTNFDIKGTTIQNFDNNDSFTKKIGRKSDTLVPSFVSCGPATILAEISKVNTKSRTSTGRINGHTILVRILK